MMSNRAKILIVDDEPFNVDYLEQELEDLDYDTVSAANGAEGLEQVAATRPDMILFDIMMPVMDGFTMLGKLKADPDYRDIPVVIISAMNDMASVARGIELGAEDYMPKPFDPTILKARLSAGLLRKQLRDMEKAYLQSMEKELAIGHEIQLSFLPQALPEAPGWEIAASLEAAREVAGDFYDAFATGQHICVVIGDVCDKGVGAALFMTLFRSLLRFTITAETIMDTYTAEEKLKHAVTATNNYVATIHGETGMFATVFIGLLEPETGKLSYVNAGHDRPILIRGNGSEQQELQSTGIPVGMIEDWEYATQEIDLQPGDRLFAYTDGVPEATNAAGDFFGKDRLAEILADPAPSAAALLAAVNRNLQAFIGSARQADDVTMVAVQRA
jgi:sigma-B regulation protein RsbU (phosphoserine phosphatase)